MKRRLFISIIALLIASAALDAQTTNSKSTRRKYFEFGPKIGLSAPTLNMVTNTTELKDLFNGLNTGFQVGGFARGMLPVWRGITLYMQTDALFALDLYYGEQGARASSTSFNFPIQLGGGYRFKNGTFVRGGWGVVFCVNVSQNAKTVYEGYIPALERMLRRDTVGHVADLGIDFKNLSVDLRYMNQFRSIDDWPRVADESRYISWGLTVGYRF